MKANIGLKMSNLTSFALASIFSLLAIWGFYFLIKKWSKFHLTLFGKVLKVLYVLTLLLVIIVSLIVAYEGFDRYWEDDRVRVITEFQGVKLGWSKDEVLFRLGEPESIDIKDDAGVYLNYGMTKVKLDNDKVTKIGYVCDEDRYDYEKVGGITCKDSADRIIKQYGKPKNLAISDNKLSRIYSYPNSNLAFLLSKSKVEVLIVFDSTKIPNGLQFVVQSKVVNAPQSESQSEPVPINDDKVGAGKDIDLSKLSDAELLALQNGDTAVIDHCAPDLNKSERLRRLALKGTVRETGYQTYSTGNYEIAFSSNDVISCR